MLKFILAILGGFSRMKELLGRLKDVPESIKAGGAVSVATLAFLSSMFYYKSDGESLEKKVVDNTVAIQNMDNKYDGKFERLYHKLGKLDSIDGKLELLIKLQSEDSSRRRTIYPVKY